MSEKFVNLGNAEALPAADLEAELARQSEIDKLAQQVSKGDLNYREGMSVAYALEHSDTKSQIQEQPVNPLIKFFIRSANEG